MSLARGRFGIEFDPDQNRRDGASGLGWAVILVLLVVAVSLVATVIGRVRHRADEEKLLPPAAVTAPAKTPPAEETALPAPPAPRGFSEVFATLSARPAAVRTLLMKLKEAQQQKRLPDEVATIVQLRELPDNPALDLNNLLVKRLGELNMSWLFDRYNPQWVKTVTVKSGDSASRIARENGSTLASLRRLNPGVDVDRLRKGETLRVMDRPRFCLCVYPNTRKADLQIKGRFFKRYTLREAVTCPPGTYEPTGTLRNFLADHGVWLNYADRAELEMLLPNKFTFVIGDL